MVKQPFFSIVIPTYNRVEDLKRAISCILNQSFHDYEILVSDNHSTDGTKERIAALQIPSLRYVENSKNIGVIMNMKKAIAQARGVYCVLHGDDDFFYDRHALRQLKKYIDTYTPGYVRMNYLSYMSENQKIFDFRASKGFEKDEVLEPNKSNQDVIDFILQSDPSFITGIVFKNYVPPTETIINSQLSAWIKILFYNAKRFGACYIEKPYIIARWSQWSVQKVGYHPIYSVDHRRLTIESYLEAIKRLLPKNDYAKFLRSRLMDIYVKRFPAVVYYTGKTNMIQLATRIRVLDSSITSEYLYWIYYVMALITPYHILAMMRKYILSRYMKRQGKQEDEISGRVIRQGLI